MSYEVPIAMTGGCIQIAEQRAPTEAEDAMWLMADAIWRQRPRAEAVFANWVSENELVVFVPEEETCPT